MTTKDILKKTLVEFSRFLLGITFMFSGFVKAVDPLGTTYKIEDYFTAFGLNSFSWLALPLSVLLCVVEFSAGAFMFLGIYRKWTSRVMLLIMLFMTPLTLYLAIANPVSDCGCFGDALIITNWQTFYKNIFLLLAAVVCFIYYGRITNFFTGKFYWMVGLFVVAFGIIFSLYNYYHEPVFDFRPYKIGANIPELMKVEDGKGDVYENVFIYEKDGVKKEFSEDNYPWHDTTWVFVDRQNKLIKEGEKPEITDFVINRLYLSPDKTEFEGEENITQEVLEDSSYVFLMISYSLNDMRETYLSRFEDVNNYAKDYDYKFYCLTSSTKDYILQWENENANNFVYCLTDARTLKTMARSNPGLILMKNGIIINKWTGSEVPSEKELVKPLDELSYGQPVDTKKENKENLISIILIFVVPLSVLKALDVLIYRKKNRNKTDNN
ncbi:MAG: BT_3928 family protein [Dysgonomonas sp.]